MRRTGIAEATGGGTHVDDRPATGGDHLRELLVHSDEGGAEVDGDRRIEGLDVDIGQGAWAGARRRRR
jgi:hypothetical protein